ncbi:Ankyrin repeat-containing protein [Mycena chlorophos]|uniref:Ankyrin repeat-containing protein n=1 Tax=Mycena chlorophos TaxID=658473 RepID=A0A8H6TJH7_MYCCL|nr:Ankyrin repeat-containing protein [Mycena chlorophos]
MPEPAVHPALRLSAIDVLPPTIARSVKAACRRDASKIIVQRALRLARSPDSAATGRRGFLPFLYTLLDPAEIPALPSLETQLDDLLPLRIESTTVLTHFIMEVPATARLDIWHRLWPWLEFYHTAWEQYGRGLGFLEPVSLYELVLFLCGMLSVDPGVSLAMTSNPAFYLFMGRAWKALFPAEISRSRRARTRTPHTSEGILFPLSSFIKNMNVENPPVLANLVAGVGGSFDELARCIIELLDTASGVYQVPYLLPSAVSRNVQRTDGVLMLLGLVAHIDHIAPPIQSANPKFNGTPPMVIAMGTGNLKPLLATIIATIIHLCDEPSHNSMPALRYCLPLLRNALHTKKYLAYGLECGLIRCLVGCAALNLNFEGFQDDPLSGILMECVAPGVWDHSLFQRIKTAVDAPEVRKLSAVSRFAQTEFAVAWGWFSDYLRARENDWAVIQRPVNQFHEGHQFIKICDNLSCGKVARPASLRRCAACRTMHYCSSACQAADWNDGNHRNRCHILAETVLGKSCFLSRNKAEN